MKGVDVNFLEGVRVVRVYYGCLETCYGKMVVFGDGEWVVGLHFLVRPMAWYVGLAKRKFVDAEFIHDEFFGRRWYKRLEGEAGVSVVLEGTKFQKKVWRGLCGVPLGSTISYEGLAVGLGLGVRSARAVAGAVGSNFIACLVPCHRVIGKGGGLVGYSWGMDRKALLLADEGAIVGGVRDRDE